MKIISRNGQLEHLDLTKIVTRIKKACSYCGRELSVDPDLVAIKVIENIRDNITTSELDDITAKICINMSMDNPEYGLLGSRIAVSNHQKNVKVSFSEAMENLYNNNGKQDARLISDQLIQTVRLNKTVFDNLTQDLIENDFLIDFFGLKTLERSYFLKDSSGKMWETPQYLWLRVAIGIWGDNTLKVTNTYKMLSSKAFIHATPTLFNSGNPRPSMSSCFLLGTEDSIDGIYNTITDCAKISKWAGGIGVHISNVRPKGSYIKGTGGKTDGIIPMMKVYNATARYVNQCFTPDTVIYTNNGAKEIKDVKPVIDKVVTSDHTFRQVNQIVTQEIDKEILHITCQNNSDGPLKCTDVHEILIHRPPEDVTNYNLSTHYFNETVKDKTIQRKFVPAKEIQKGDFMCFPIPRTITKQETNRLSFEQIDKLITNFREYGTYTEKFATLDNQSLQEILDVILEENIRDLECEQIGNQQMKNSPLKVFNLNKKSYDNLRYLFIRLGQLTHGRKLPGNVGPSGCAYETNFPKNKFISELTGSRIDEYCGFFEKDGWLYTPVVDIQKEHYRGTVYDLNVQDNHDYLTENGLVHNSGKRNGSIACYLEPWHGDIFDFLGAMRNHGHEETLARDLFYALWIPDLFMKQVKSGGDWYLMDNNINSKLTDLYGEEFEEYYYNCVSQGRYIKKIKAQDLWNEILKSQQESGMPYICYKDHVNRKSNQKNIGTIKSSNLCVSPETMILTRNGYYRIDSLVDHEVEVWNGEEWSQTTIRKTGENQKLVKVVLSDGRELECTEYHKFYIETGSRPANNSKPQEVRACNLKCGNKLIRNNISNVLIDNEDIDEFKDPYTHGFYCADGTNCKNTKIISLYGEKKKLINHLSIKSSSYKEDSSGRINTTINSDLKDKFIVPINYSIKTKLQWLSGYLDGDGTISKNGTNQSIQCSSIHKDFLTKIQLMLQTLGVESKIHMMSDERETLLPDGKGSRKYFKCKACYRLIVGSNGTVKLNNLGLSCKRLKFNNHIPNRISEHFVKVKEVIQTDRISDTYCFTEPKRNMGIFNGILTGNCAEINEYSDSTNTAVCNLGSVRLQSHIKQNESGRINNKLTVYTKESCSWCDLVKVFLDEQDIEYETINIPESEKQQFFDSKKVTTFPQVYDSQTRIGGFMDTVRRFRPQIDYTKLRHTVHTLVENIDRIIDINHYPTEKAKRNNFSYRPMGIGVQGLADMFAGMWIPYESDDALDVNKQIFEAIYYYAIEKSLELAKNDKVYSAFDGSPLSRGEFQFDLWGVKPTERFDWESLRKQVMEYGVKNSLMIALMPTASTAQILGSTEAFEPFNSCMYLRRTLSGEFLVINQSLIDKLIKLGIWDNTMKQRIMFHRGSIQKIQSIPSYIKDLYKTVWEIKKKHYLKMSADRGAYVCQSQSLNIYVEANDRMTQMLSNIHMYGWSLGLKTGSYYIRTRPATNAQTFTIDPKMEEQFIQELESQKVQECLNCGA